ncbi:MAG: hypothetical protein JWN03_1843 [Nocardia sp.]|nr:hypothetical protein [Nocardia sp.]
MPERAQGLRCGRGSGQRNPLAEEPEAVLLRLLRTAVLRILLLGTAGLRILLLRIVVLGTLLLWLLLLGILLLLLLLVGSRLSVRNAGTGAQYAERDGACDCGLG